MCLYVDKIRTEQVHKSPLRPLRAYFKAFIRKEGYLLTPYMEYRVNGPGVFTAPASLKGINISTGMVGAGAFHARVSKGALKQDLFWVDQFELGFVVVLEVQVKASDIVAFGNQDNVAFTQYEITHMEWDGAFKRKAPVTMKDLLENCARSKNHENEI